MFCLILERDGSHFISLITMLHVPLTQNIHFSQIFDILV